MLENRMSGLDEFLEQLWDRLLSREPEKILQAFGELDQAERGLILTHLQRMTTEPDWHPEQVRSAQAAIDTIKEIKE